MAVTPAFELTVEKKPTLPHLPPTAIGEDVRLTMTSIVLSATVTLRAQEIVLLDGAQLGFVQVAWLHRYWSRYEGASMSDGSALIDQVSPGEYNRIVYTDTVLTGDLFYAPPDQAFVPRLPPEDLPDYRGELRSLAGSMIIDRSKASDTTTRLVMGDLTMNPISSKVYNTTTEKANVLTEVFVQQEFYVGLVARERSGVATCLGHVHWWQSYHYNEQSSEAGTTTGTLTHVAVPAETYIRVGAPAEGPPRDPAFLRAMLVPSPISASEATGDAAKWSIQCYGGHAASGHIPRPAPFGVFS